MLRTVWRPGRPLVCSFAVLAAVCGWQYAGLAGEPVVPALPAPPVAAATPAVSAPVAMKLGKEEADGLIFERQQIMTQLDKDADLLGQIVSGEAPPDKLAAVTRAIAADARDSAAAFRQNVPGGRSKPEVWTNWTDFSQRMDSFVRNASEMARVGEKGDVTAVSSTLGDALPCKQCHDVYRAPKT